MDELERAPSEFALSLQVCQLAQKYFRDTRSIPSVEVADVGSGNGPAWLNALDGTIFIDERVAEFREKTTKILILHELVHYALYLENGDPDDGEGDRFQEEITRLLLEGAYARLL